jgi:parallel beta-helix repeat protein
MKKSLILAMVLSVLLIAAPVSADSGTLYVDDDYTSSTPGWGVTHFAHPQDAVNAANPGDTIEVYPGTYGHRQFTSPVPPHWNSGDQYAPALIVWKDGLTIEAVDPDPSQTVIQTTYNFWVNKALPGGGGGGSIEHSTGCTWNPVTKTWDGTCVRPTFGTPPNTVAIIASNVTIRGFTLHRPFDFTDGTYNTAGVMIGGLYAGDSSHLGSNSNTVENCVFSDVWHAVYIWHSSGNRIVNNTVAALNTNHWAAISTYDGYNDAQINLGYPSENNLIANNTLTNKGIALGAWAPPTWTSNAGSQVCHNTTTQVGVTYAHGPVIVGCNTGGFWHPNTDNVLRIKGVAYTGDTSLVGTNNVAVNLSAQLDYDGSANGSGVEVVFTINSTDYSATTVAGGLASTTISLPFGSYTVQTQVAVCDDCKFTDMDALVIKAPPTVDAGGPYDVNEGGSVMVTASGNDPEGCALTYAWDLDNDGSFETAGQSVSFSAAGLDGPSQRTIRVQATDLQELTAVDEATVNIANVTPTVGPITAPMDPVQANTPINTTADFTDPGVADTHTAVWDWGDGTSSAGEVNESNGSGSVSGSHTYSVAGIYTVKLTVTDDDDGKGESVFQFIVVYDPTGGFVTGGGWIWSPEGAYAADPNLEGKATFGFVSKYKKGANVPEGNTEFQFKAGNLNFHSSSYDWLVVNQGGTNAQFKGMGTINGEGSYKFMLWAGDHDSDTFRIKIWWEDDSDEHLVYDNGTDQEIGGGQIVVHKK